MKTKRKIFVLFFKYIHLSAHIQCTLKWCRSRIRLHISSQNGVKTKRTSKKLSIFMVNLWFGYTFYSTEFILKLLTQSTWEACDSHTHSLYVHLTVSVSSHALHDCSVWMLVWGIAWWLFSGSTREGDIISNIFCLLRERSSNQTCVYFCSSYCQFDLN